MVGKYKSNTLKILRDNGDNFSVLVTVKDERTGEIKQLEDTLSHKTFDFGVEKGLLKKMM
ncbi:hypothetical protein [Treponema sp.]|uniref:hypothetical protein n=1 Tax=Treponema sp. TaxID=166 RepID=UPI00260101F3|nr:hypothetical protein [Treponema sp.]MBR4320975.1 hypothetical protein [Treponema sp.]